MRANRKTRLRRRREVAAGLALGVALDTALPDPRRRHPVALFGDAASVLERRVWTDSRLRGVGYWLACVLPPVGVGLLCERLHGNARVALVAAATWTVLGGRSLRVEADMIRRQLAAGHLDVAREQLTHLVGRDPSQLDAAEISRAAVESVAENTCDAVLAPLFWGAVAGVPGLLGYRAVNTLDAMVGHRSTRYTNFGWAAARADDLANLAPARITALFVAAAAPLVGGSATDALRIAGRDGQAHPSPNSGVSEAAYAGGLGIQLGGRNDYAGRIEDRPVLGDGRPVELSDLARARQLCANVAAIAGLAAAAAAATLARSGSRGR